MKAEIHPKYHKDANIICACGNSVQVGSTLAEINVELCNKCHPFYTGKQNLIDAAGRIDKFKRLESLKSEDASGKKAKNAKRTAIKAEKRTSKATVEIGA